MARSSRCVEALVVSTALRFDASVLPSGTYLVRMTAMPENGAATRTFTERITLLR